MAPGDDGGMAAHAHGEWWLPSGVGDDQDLLSAVHKVVLKQFGLLLLDLLTLPFAIVVLSTYYRLAPLRDSLESDAALVYHRGVMWNFLVVLHDLVQLPFALLLLLSGYRYRRTCGLLSGSDGDCRGALWYEVLHFAADLLCLPFFLLLLLTVWRADLVIVEICTTHEDCARRWCVLKHTVWLVRDVLGFLLAILVAVSLLRLPRLVLDIWSQRARTLQGEPRFRLRQVTLLLPDGTATDRRPCLTIDAEQLAARRRDEIGMLRLNVVSQPFWDEVARVFGGMLASVGKGLLPFALSDGKHMNFCEVAPQRVNFQLRIGGSEMKKRLLQLDASINVCVQIEHLSPTGEEEVLLRFPLQLSLLQRAAENPGDILHVSDELLEPGAENIVCGSLVEGLGIREGLWFCAATQLWQLILDIMHIAMMLLTCITPWRLVTLSRFLRGPDRMWPAYVANRATRLVALRDDALSRYRFGLEPALNTMAKRHAEGITLRDGFSAFRTLAFSQLSEYALPPRSVERALSAELKRLGALDIVQHLEEHNVLQEAASAYWTSLSFAANLHVTLGDLSPLEHAQVLRYIAMAEQRADGFLAESISKLEELVVQMPSGELTNAFWGEAWSKPLETQRHLIRTFFLRALTDWVVCCLLLLLIVTFYRLPGIIAEIQRSGGASRASMLDRSRIAITHQVWLLARDLRELLTAVFACALALITVVRALDFLTDATLHCDSLSEVRAAGFRRAGEAVSAFWELIVLLTVWKTYRFVVRAAIFGLLLPASGFLGPPPKCRVSFWILLCALPWLLPYPLLALMVLACAMTMSFGLAVHRGICSTVEFTNSSFSKGSVLRFSWANILALLAIPLEAFFLVSAPDGTTFLMSQKWFHVAVCTSIIWLLAVALPPAMPEEDGEACRNSLRYHATVQLLRRCCLLPSAGILLVAGGSDDISARVSISLLVLLASTSVLGLEQQRTTGLPISLGLDLVHPPLYLAGMAFGQLMFLSAELLNAPTASVFAASLLAPCWTVFFSYYIGPVGGPNWVLVLREGVALVPVWVQLCKLVDLPLPAEQAQSAVWPGYFVLGVFTSSRIAWSVSAFRSERREAMLRSGLDQLLLVLSCRGSILCRADDTNGDAAALKQMSLGPAPSASACAAALEAFEGQIRIERLHLHFLQQRKVWLEKLRDHRHSFGAVAASAQELLSSIQTPPSIILMIAAMRSSSSVARRVSPSLWAIIMEFVGGTKLLGTLLQLITEHFSGGKPDSQLERAQANMKWCASANTRIVRLREVLPGSAVTYENALFGFAVCLTATRLAEQGNLVETGDIGFVKSIWDEQCRVEWQTLAAPGPRVGDFLLAELEVAHCDDSAILQEELAKWWDRTPSLYGAGCKSCGRSPKPTEYCVCRPPFRIIWPCCPATYTRCCRSCARRGYHSSQCDRRAQQDFRCYRPIRRLAEGLPVVEFPSSSPDGSTTSME